MTVVAGLSVLLTGLLAGGELLVRWGVAPTLSRLPDHAHLLARQALVRRLRVLVPAVMGPAVVVTVVALVLAPVPLRWFGTAALVVFVLVSFLGTVPINIRVDGWNAADPPAGWRELVQRWERVDVVRSSAATVAFACLLAASVWPGI